VVVIALAVALVVTRDDHDGEGKPVARTTTDQDGRFRIVNVPAGSFNLSAFAPAFVFDERSSWGQYGKRMTISPGEAVEGVDVSLKSGGVITGKVSDSAGRPVVEERVTLTMIDEQGRLRSFIKSDLREFTILSKSPMPSYKGKLTDTEVADVVAYLMTLKGGAPVATNSAPAAS